MKTNLLDATIVKTTEILPRANHIEIDQQTVTICAFDASESRESLAHQTIQVIASGPSIADLAFAAIQDRATIFVNGSISLLAEHAFDKVAGYVISDARFIRHRPEIFKDHYNGQPLYATLAVFEALAIAHSDILLTHHKAMRVICPVDRHWGVQSNRSWLSKLTFKRRRLNKKRPLSDFSDHPNLVIDSNHRPAIGVSLDVTDGFVEAGTVAYVAAQLAFSRQTSEIHLYGIDLLNTNQPRFYENLNNSAPCKLDKAITDRIVPSFDLLAQVYKARGVMVYNHSEVSKDLFHNLVYQATDQI
ncbi:hypothetical protein [Psychrobacter sp. Ps4]|uniref:hypothetical protein n=1 Tax=Psychrobacter sp. Ps4 TaxID=2790958 RepID=UPI001EDEFBA8|nr:hypothetical protein [Psychrobacter sp. Ps4]